MQVIEKALYLVPTPIGNLEDITLRAINVLKAVDFIACEDTRTTGHLLNHLGISKKLISYHDYNEVQKSDELANLILSGKSIALVSDAGTPCISDPGYRIVNAAIEKDVKIIALPGANAVLPALIASGMSVHSFVFMGFPPAKKGRQTFINKALNQEFTCIIYESSHKIEKLLEQINEFGFSERHICVAKEISKVFENYYRGTASEILAELQAKNASKGEFVVVIAGKE